MKKKLTLPRFKTAADEKKFWDKIDLADYFNSADFQAVSFPNLKPTSRAISIRLSEPLLLRLKETANEMHIPYQALIKQYIADGIKRKAA